MVELVLCYISKVENHCCRQTDTQTLTVYVIRCFRTHLGRARAWLRLALMQKKLADYLKVLIDHKDEALEEYFEPDALMLSDEAIIIIGLLVGLNVIDCNLCVKVSFPKILRKIIYIQKDNVKTERLYFKL